MPDENVNKWKQKGQLYLWRYLNNTRNYPGWHLTPEETFCHGFADLAQRMLNAEYNCQKILSVTPPTKEVLRVPNNQGGLAGWKAPNILILKHQKTGIPDDYFCLEESENTVIIAAGRQNLELLRDCVLNVIQGENDYCIEIGSSQLWFW